MSANTPTGAVNAPSQLTNVQIKAFKAQAHHLSPVVMIGAAGLTDAVMREVELALTAHQLIKVSVAGDDREQRQAIAQQICDTLLCSQVQVIGKQLILYREAVDKSDRNEPHQPKKQIAQGVTKIPPRGGKARAKPAKTNTRTNPAKLKRGPSNRVAAKTGSNRAPSGRRGR